MIQQLYADPDRVRRMRPFTRLDDPDVSCAADRRRDRLTFGQSVVHEYCKLLTERQHGLLVLHSTGSGKTCSAAAVMDAFRPTGRHFVYVTSVAALRANPPQKFEDCMRDLLASRLDKERTHFMSFAQLAHSLFGTGALNERRRKYLRRCVLIIDEVHRLFHPLPNQTAEHKQVLDWLLGTREGYDVRIVVMTATPGDDPEEVVKLLNIVRDPSQPPIRVPGPDADEERAFMAAISGLVSFLDLSRDRRLYPRVEEVREEVRMAPEHFAVYERKAAEAPADEADYDRLAADRRLERFLRTARKYANAMFDLSPERELAEFSAKVERLLDQVTRQHPREKHFVYSAFYENRGFGGQGVRAVGRLLERAGYEQLKPENAASTLEPRRRFIYLINSELGGDESETRMADNVQALLRVFNSAENRDGRLAQVILASQGFNESVDLTAVRHIHLLEPLVNYAKHVQVTGRAARLCSHKQLGDEFGEWTVYVHNYISRGPPDPLRIVDVSRIVRAIDAVDVLTYHRGASRELSREREELMAKYEEALRAAREARETVDARVTEEARRRYAAMERMQMLLAAAAIDCTLTRGFHAHPFPCFSGRT